jgi:hypothetical protein
LGTARNPQGILQSKGAENSVIMGRVNLRNIFRDQRENQGSRSCERTALYVAEAGKSLLLAFQHSASTSVSSPLGDLYTCNAHLKPSSTLEWYMGGL